LSLNYLFLDPASRSRRPPSPLGNRIPNGVDHPTCLPRRQYSGVVVSTINWQHQQLFRCSSTKDTWYGDRTLADCKESHTCLWAWCLWRPRQRRAAAM